MLQFLEEIDLIKTEQARVLTHITLELVPLPSAYCHPGWCGNKPTFGSRFLEQSESGVPVRPPKGVKLLESSCTPGNRCASPDASPSRAVSTKSPPLHCKVKAKMASDKESAVDTNKILWELDCEGANRDPYPPGIFPT